MPSQDKLIKQGILLTDNLFDEIAKRLSRGVKASDTLEAFLNQTKEYTTNNPLVLNGYKDKMLELILQETNNHKFSRPAQRELTRATIEKRVGDRIVDVGEDIIESVRDIVKWGYNNNKSQDEIADEITHRVDVIKNTRARTIARTEVARTATASDYVINKERGATHFTVDCRDTCCDICARDYNWGKIEYTIDQVEMLPPRHPNCYSKDTKVFTDKGWKYFKDLSDDDLLLSMNPKGNELEFIKPIRLIKYKNTDKKLYHIHNRWFDVCVTEDHDCFIHQRRDGGSKGRYLEPQFRKPSELTSESRFIRCIDVDRENPKVVNINGLEFEPKDFAFFMAWFISEGSVLHNPETAKQHGYPVKITQEIGENREVLERELQRIFGYLGFRVAIGKSYFEVYSKQLYDYLLPLGYSNEKYIPSEVFTLNKECLNIFLDNYVLGDGHERVSDNELVQNSSERALFTSSPRLRDDLSYLVLLCGYYPSISLHTPKGKVSAHKNGTYVQNNTVFRIAVNRSKHTNYSGCTVDLIEYNDYVYCAELPKWHTLWVMRNGKTSWNGNCRCYARYSIKEGSEVKARKTPYPVQTSTGAGEPTKEQLSNNLTAMERSKYANYKRLVDSHTKWLNDNPDAPAKQIENHKKKLAAALVKLNELKAKALGGSVPASKPKTAPKPKTPSKPKSKSKKPKTGEKLPTPTTKQLKENLTPDELKKYKRYQKEIKEGKLSPAFLEIRKKDLENLTRKALGLKPLKGTTPKRPTPKKTSTPKKPKSTSKPKLPKTERKRKSESTTSKKPASTTQTITDESKTLIPPKVTKKLDNFGKEYGNSSKEHMQFFTENNSSEASHGSTGTVSKSGKQIQFLQQETEKGNVIHGTHTHPNDHKHYTMLSHEDVVDVFMRLNNDGINLGSFSAENKRNRITVVKLPNYNQYTEYSKRSGVKVDLRMAVNGAFATHVEDYRNVRGSSSGGELQFLREKRAELKEKYPDIKGYELMEKMKHYEEEASKIDWEKDHRKKIDNAYKEMIKNVNKDLERFGIRFEVEYKD